MLPLLPTHPLALKTIKVLSCILIAGALALVAAKAAGLIESHTLLEKVFWIGTVALLLHGMEAIVAAVLAYRLQENPVKAGIYTFWTGAAGIMDILQRLQSSHETTVEQP